MKNLLFFVTSLLYTTTMFSQLFVRPNPTTSEDSFVYVKDQILFVEQGINLKLNTNDATTKASIYLRGESQLIQGSSNTANSGNGYLSVYQETPDDDSWDYTYWHSPVGHYITPSGNENFGIWRIHDSTNKI